MRVSSRLRASILVAATSIVVALSGQFAWAQEEEGPTVDAAAALAVAAEVLGSEAFGFACEIKDPGVLVAQTDANVLTVTVDGDVLCVEVPVLLPEGTDAAALAPMCNDLNKKAKLARYTVEDDGFIMAEFGTLVVEQLDSARFAAEAMGFLEEFSRVGEG